MTSTDVEKNFPFTRLPLRHRDSVIEATQVGVETDRGILKLLEFKFEEFFTDFPLLGIGLHQNAKATRAGFLTGRGILAFAELMFEGILTMFTNSNFSFLCLGIIASQQFAKTITTPGRHVVIKGGSAVGKKVFH
ncbi:Hypothetical predicted protein [Paramuricea clavata]|uniref:Uncharacterized protein n=1 Tax=Paramuricea clavata TaxID=317549 RepID=A0A7D9MGY9_PARCT|nr:Hypothetical predicted protein [Paramuricea clavata]